MGRDVRQTWAWRQLRANVARALPLPCLRCGVPIQPGERFHLDHRIALVDGGAPFDVGPSHPACNLRHGAQITHARVRARRAAELAVLDANGFVWEPESGIPPGTRAGPPQPRDAIPTEPIPSRIY